MPVSCFPRRTLPESDRRIHRHTLDLVIGLPALAWFLVLRRSRIGSIALVPVAAIVIETVGIHLLVPRWSDVAAGVLTTLSVYSLIWLLGDYHGVRLNPHVVDDRTLHARAGLRWRAEIPLEAVRRVRRYRHTDAEADVLSLAVFGDPDVVVDLDRSVTLRGLSGTRRKASALGLSVDDRTGFVDDVTRRMTRGS